MSKTAFDEFFDEQMRDPEFAQAYRLACEDIATIDRTLADIMNRPENTEWIGYLPEPARMSFAKELAEVIRSGDREKLRMAVFGWKATAEIYSDPKLAAELTRPLDLDSDEPPYCPACDVSMVVTHEDFDYCAAPGRVVTIVGAEIRRCRACARMEVSIQAASQIPGRLANWGESVTKIVYSQDIGWTRAK